MVLESSIRIPEGERYARSLHVITQFHLNIFANFCHCMQTLLTFSLSPISSVLCPPELNANRRVAELRESLVEEGRRRQLLYKERRWTTTSELRRVRAEQVAVNEKEGMVRLWLQVKSRQA